MPIFTLWDPCKCDVPLARWQFPCLFHHVEEICWRPHSFVPQLVPVLGVPSADSYRSFSLKLLSARLTCPPRYCWWVGGFPCSDGQLFHRLFLCLPDVSPSLNALVRNVGWGVRQLICLVLHTGGPCREPLYPSVRRCGSVFASLLHPTSPKARFPLPRLGLLCINHRPGFRGPSAQLTRIDIGFDVKRWRRTPCRLAPTSKCP